jgi:hypothetical protein
MSENRTQVCQLTAVDILELTEQILNLTDQVNSLADQVNSLADQMLRLAIPTEPGTIETLVPEPLRDRYEEQNRDGELCRLVAELQNFIQRKQWELTHQFAVKHIFFFSGDRRLFGINLFSTRPRLTFCGITEEIARSIIPEYNFTSYPQYSQLVCRRGPTVEDLCALFEFIYHNDSS